MTYNREHTIDLNSDQLKNRSKITLLSATNNPGISKSGRNAYPATLDLKTRVENLHGGNFYAILVSKASEGNN